MEHETQNPIPFKPSDKKFGDILSDDYIKPAIAWMTRQKGSQILNNLPLTSAEQDSCWWATALYIEAFLNCLEFEKLFLISEQKILSDKAVHLANVLVENQSKSGAWDEPKGVWDTSASCRALLLLLKYSRSNPLLKLTQSFQLDLIEAVEKGMKWLLNLVINWDSIRYPYGPEDLATVLRLLRACHDIEKSVYPKLAVDSAVITDSGLIIPKNEVDFADIIVQMLIRMESKQNDPPEFPQIYWDSVFSTAQIVRGFCEVINLIKPETRQAGMKSLMGALMYIEAQQDDGRWGLPNTTSVVLEAYVLGCRVVKDSQIDGSEKFEAKSFIVFKAIRWLVEQRASDGSIAHAYWHTVFFTLMLESLYLQKHVLFNYSVIQLYDLVIWESENYFSQERRAVYNLTYQLSRSKGEIEKYVRLFNVTITAFRVSILFLSIYIIIFSFITFNWLQLVYNPLQINLLKPEVVFSFLFGAIPLLYAYWIYSRKWLKNSK